MWDCLESAPTDELFALHQRVIEALRIKLLAKKFALEDRLRQLGKLPDQTETQRNVYPAAVPRFRNPEQPSQTWSGRGRQPRWLVVQLRSGRQLADFRTEQSAAVPKQST